jgi:hypothetical protein
MLFREPTGILQARCSMQASFQLNKTGVHHSSHLWNIFSTSKKSQGHLPTQNNNFAVGINSKVQWKLNSYIVKWVCGWKIGEGNFWLLFQQVNYCSYKFELRVSVHRGLLNKIPTRCSKSSLFFFVFCSTCFGRYIHPSSGASTVQAGMV